MEFLKRLGFYMIGLAIGIVFLAFFLKKKICGNRNRILLFSQL